MVAAVAYGLSDFWAARATRSLGPITAAFLVNLVVLAAVMAAYVAVPDPGEHATTSATLVRTIGASVLIALGLLAFFKALALGPVSLVSPISSAYPLVTTLMAVFVFHHSLPQGKLLGIVLATTGVMVASGLLQKPARGAHVHGAGPAMALLTALCWGAGYGLIARSLETMSWQLATLIEIAVIVALSGALLVFSDDKGGLRSVSAWRRLGDPWIVGAGLLQAVALAALNLGLSLDSSAAVVAALSASYPLLTMALACLHFNERPGVISLCGALVGVGGVVLLSLR
jgi:drug/metabolite transporter (DMT)-like permease